MPRGSDVTAAWVRVLADGEPELLQATVERQDDRDTCLLYTSDAADERSSVDLGGRRIIKKKKLRHEQTSNQYRKYNKIQHTNNNVQKEGDRDE